MMGYDGFMCGDGKGDGRLLLIIGGQGNDKLRPGRAELSDF